VSAYACTAEGMHQKRIHPAIAQTNPTAPVQQC
jgi:hypothetical protein